MWKMLWTIYFILRFKLLPVVNFEFHQYKNFLLGILATVARVASNARTSSAEIILPLRLSNSILESLNASANICNSSIMNKLLERSRSFSYWCFLITWLNYSATSDVILLLAAWQILRFLFNKRPSASLCPA